MYPQGRNANMMGFGRAQQPVLQRAMSVDEANNRLKALQQDPLQPVRQNQMRQQHPRARTSQGILFYSAIDETSKEVVSAIYEKMPDLFQNIDKVDVNSTRRIPKSITTIPTLIVKQHPQPLLGEAIIWWMNSQHSNTRRQHSSPSLKPTQEGIGATQGFNGDFSLNHDVLQNQENQSNNSLDQMYAPIKPQNCQVSQSTNNEVKINDQAYNQYLQQRQNLPAIPRT